MSEASSIFPCLHMLILRTVRRRKILAPPRRRRSGTGCLGRSHLHLPELSEGQMSYRMSQDVSQKGCISVIQLYVNKRFTFLRMFFFFSEKKCSICVRLPYQMHRGLSGEVTTVWNVPVSPCLIRTIFQESSHWRRAGLALWRGWVGVSVPVHSTSLGNWLRFRHSSWLLTP